MKDGEGFIAEYGDVLAKAIRDLPTVEFGDRKQIFDVDLKKCERLYRNDGSNWRAGDGKRVPTASGRLANPLPVLTGGETEIAFSSADDTKTSVRI